MPELLVKVSIFLSFDLSTIILAISHIKKNYISFIYNIPKLKSSQMIRHVFFFIP